MYQYDYEKGSEPMSCDSRVAVSCDNRDAASCGGREAGSRDWYARRPLPPRPVCGDLRSNTSVPLKVWIIAGASCFAVCGALVLATIVITKWGTTVYPAREIYPELPEPIYAAYPARPKSTTEESVTQESSEFHPHVLEKLSIFKSVVGNREKKKQEDLISKPQLHPIHDALHHAERRIEKKDHPKLPEQSTLNPERNKIANLNIEHPDSIADSKIPNLNSKISTLKTDIENKKVPEFKPTLPDVFLDSGIKLSDGYFAGLQQTDQNYEEYYNDENLYDDYMQSNTMTSYLIEKVQELHDWVTSDPDFQGKHKGSRRTGDEFGQLLKALNESLIEGNVTIIMSKLKDIYFGENYTNVNDSRKVILKNNTSLLSFGILTLDVMLLHNIQLIAWENQESARVKMLKDPDVFAFNALFMEPAKVEAGRSGLQHHDAAPKHHRQDANEETVEKNLLENVLEIGMSTARAAIHLGRAYKNTRMVLNQLSNRESLNTNIQNQISRNIEANGHALNHLQTTFSRNESAGGAAGGAGYTDLDCMWLLYCRNLVATAKLSAPYGTMARINGLALRMLTGELPADRALDTLLYEMIAGWTEIRCGDMFPKCSKANPAAIVLDSILQPLRKSQTNRL